MSQNKNSNLIQIENTIILQVDMSNQDRTDLFTIPHKMYRWILSNLSLDFQQCDWTNAEQVEKLEGGVKMFAEALHDHAQGEEICVISEIEKTFPGELGVWSDDHQCHEHEFDQILSGFSKIRNAPQQLKWKEGTKLCQAFNEFQVKILAHMNEEEVKWMPWIWERFDEKAVLKMEYKSMESFPHEDKVQKIPHLFKVINPKDRVEFFNTIKAVVTDPKQFQEVSAAIKNNLEEKEWERLSQQVNGESFKSE